MAVKELAIADGLPVLTPTATNPDVTLDAANVFRACYTDSYQGSVAAVFAADTLNATDGAGAMIIDENGMVAILVGVSWSNTLKYSQHVIHYIETSFHCNL